MQLPESGEQKVPVSLIGYVLVAVFCGTGLLTNWLVTYPMDNDLDEVGWIIANQSLDRMESLANNSYPFGYPFLLKFIYPVFGGVLPAALVMGTLATTGLVFMIMIIGYRIYENHVATLGIVIVAGFLLFESAISEFADAICAFSLFTGLYLCIRDGFGIRGYIALGLCIGLAYLFRYHYMSMGVAIAVASLALGFSFRQLTIRLAGFSMATLLVASPQILFNILDHGSPISHPYQAYVTGIFLHHEMDFGAFMETYANWPLSRVLAETPLWVFADHVFDTLDDLLDLPYIALAIFCIPAAFILTPQSQRRSLLFLIILATIYVGLIVLPSRYTFRAMVPVTAISALLIGAVLVGMIRYITVRWRWLVIALVAIPVLYAFTPVEQNSDLIGQKLRRMERNVSLLAQLDAAGMKSSREVYSELWNFHPLNDPEFITFHNHGGWMLQDSKYAAELPNTLTVDGLDDWERFFRQFGLRYAVVGKYSSRYREFHKDRLREPWERVGKYGDYHIVRLNDH